VRKKEFQRPPLVQQPSVTARIIIRHNFPIPSCSEPLETWIPDGGFEIAKRELKTADGGSAAVECILAKWPDDKAACDLPCARQMLPASDFRRVSTRHREDFVLAGRYGLFTTSIPRAPVPGQVVKADLLPPEPVEIWPKEIQALRGWRGVVGFDYCTKQALTNRSKPSRLELLIRYETRPGGSLIF
jgi:hypothetical protein